MTPEQPHSLREEFERVRLKQAFMLLFDYPLEMAEQLAAIKDRPHGEVNRWRIQYVQDLIEGKLESERTTPRRKR